jgi:phosphocarrier protein FPr
LTGIPASPGIAIGPVRRLVMPELPLPDDLPADPSVERPRLGAAMTATREEIARQRVDAATRLGRAEAAIFDAHLLFLEDEAVLDPTLEAIAVGRSAASAWAATVGELADRWASLEDPYLRERAEDLRSVGQQVLARILGLDPPHARLDRSGILVAADLGPADTIGLDPETCWGIATAHGGATSHAAILTRALGIPAVVGLGDAVVALAEGVLLGLDGSAGVVHVEPADAKVRALEGERGSFRKRERAARARAAAPVSTRDGVHIEVLANVGRAADLPAAVAAGCDGVGLFRTEFLFLDRNAVPDEEEQERAYREAAETLEGRPLTIRTLDAGSDKPVPGVSQGDEANPALGVRGIRLTLARPDIFGEQLRAIARVAADHDVRVMFPMVSTVEELRAGLDALADACGAVGAGLPPTGVMIEVPSAAVLASRFAGDVAFLSIGTNDLTQYVLAADRGNDAVAALGDPLHPAVLRMVRSATEAARIDLPVAVCGEVAGDPTATSLLLGLGVRELSMSAPVIPFVKEAVRRTDLGAATELAARALSAATAAEVRAMLAT